MTAGAPPDPAARTFDVSNRLVLSIAVPMTLAFMTTPLLGLTSTAVVGQLGDPALIAGLALGAMAFDFVFVGFAFLRTGTTGLVAQAFGRGDEEAERATFWRAIWVATVLGVLVAAAAPAIIALTDRFVSPAADVSAAMATYVGIRILAAPVTFINYALLGYTLGRGQAGLGLVLQLVVNGGNIVFSILLGLVLGWGVAGVAWGTVAGELLGAAAGAALVLPRFAGRRRLRPAEIADWPAFGAMMAVNRDIMIRTLLLVGGMALATRQGAQFGTVTLAANAVLMNFFLLAAYFLDGFAAAAEQLAGRAIGARDAAAFRRTVRLTALWGFALAGIAALVLLAFAGPLIALVATAPDVQAEASRYMPWAALAALSGVLAFQMDGVFIGATWSRELRNMMILSFLLFVAALWGLSAVFGNHGVWAALHVFLLARGLSLWLVMRGKATVAFSR